MIPGKTRVNAMPDSATESAVCVVCIITLPLRFSCRNKVIWVGIFSQIGIALILTYGLGHVTALNFTPLR